MATGGICIRTGRTEAAFAREELLPSADFQRYVNRELGSSVTIHELSGTESRSPGDAECWSTISTRGSDGFRGTAFVFGLWFLVPPDVLEKFDLWYEEEHTSMLLECPDWKTVRRFSGLSNPARTNRLVLHHLDTTNALNSDERAKARATSAARWFLEQEWFQKSTKQVLQRTT